MRLKSVNTTRRCLTAFALVVATAPCAVGVAAQDGNQLRLSVDPLPRLLRGGTGLVHVHVDIPPGRVVPAETRGAAVGASLESTDTWSFSRQLPTFPSANLVQLPGAGAPSLAYSGNIDIVLPIDVPPGMRGTEQVRLAFTYEECGSISCGSLTTASVRVPAQFDDLVGSGEAAAFRLDAERVVIVSARRGRIDPQGLESVQPLAQFAVPVDILPDDRNPPEFFAGTSTIGDHWTISSNGQRFDAVVERRAVITESCGSYDDAPAAFVVRTTDAASFGKERAKYFTASTKTATD